MAHTWEVYLVTEALREIGAQPGDRLVVRPGHPEKPYALVRDLESASVHQALATGCCQPFGAERVLRRRPPRRPRHLRVL